MLSPSQAAEVQRDDERTLARGIRQAVVLAVIMMSSLGGYLTVLCWRGHDGKDRVTHTAWDEFFPFLPGWVWVYLFPYVIGPIVIGALRAPIFGWSVRSACGVLCAPLRVRSTASCTMPRSMTVMILGSTSVSTPAPLQLVGLRLASRYLLSPLAGYTNLPFRLAVRELGGLGLATTDLVNARALLRGSVKSLELIDTCEADRPVSIQLYGADPAEMADAARWLQDYGASVVDINMGCPVHKVTRGGGGSAMMCDAAKSIHLVQSVARAVQIPVTVKMRLGWDDDNLSAPLLAREFEQVGVAGVIIHGRTRAQGFGGAVNHAGIRA